MPLEDIFDQLLDLDGVVGILREDNIHEFANQKLLLGVNKVFKRVSMLLEKLVGQLVVRSRMW